MAFGGAGVVLRQFGNGKGEVSTDDDHGEDEFAHRHVVGETTFGLQDVLFSIGCGTIGGFKEGGVGGFTAHGDGLDGGSEVAPVVTRNDFINIGLARNSDVVASLENVDTVEFANDAELVKREDEVVPDILDGVETKGFVAGRNGKASHQLGEGRELIHRRHVWSRDSAHEWCSGEAKLFHKDIIDKLLPEAWGFWVALESVVDGEDMTMGNWSEAFSFDPPFSKLVVNGHIEGILGRGGFSESIAGIGIKGDHAFGSDESPE
jgi:hypothetical protein